MTRELRAVAKHFAALKRVSPVAFPQARGTLEVTANHGVYVIYSPRGKVLHVGRTVRGKRGLRQRLNNHLQGQSSFVASFFRGRGAKLRQGYKYACVEVPNPRTRALLEAYAVGHLCPEHIGTGEHAS